MRMLKWLSLGAALWLLYWAVAAWGLQTALDQWFGEQRRQGWQAEFESLSTSGFPFHHTIHMAQPGLADPGTGTAWSADWIEFASPALWPGSQTLHFAPTPQRFSYFDRTLTLVAQDMQARMQLAPGLALQVEHLSLNAGPWHLSKAQDPVVEAQDLTLEMHQQDTPHQYLLTAKATGFAPATSYRLLLAADDQLPRRFETLALSALIDFDTAWDRRALELRRPQPRRIDLNLAAAQWGPIQFKAAGQLDVDEAGQLEGDLALQAQNWTALLDMAERSSLLPPNARNGLERILTLFAARSEDPEKLDITLSFSNGQMYIGPLPLGPAPVLILR